MITAADCEAACELLAEREEIATTIERIRKAKAIRIGYARTYTIEDQKGSKHERLDWSDGPEMKPTPRIMKLLLGGHEDALAEIDAKLRSLGVEPPPAAADAIDSESWPA